MLKLLPLLLVTSLLNDCGARRAVKVEPIPPILCPSWKDAAKGHKAKLADELVAAPAEAVWPDVLVADQSIKDQLVAGGCLPIK